MGQTSSIHSGKLHNQIIDEIKDLIYRYDFWTKDDICDKLSVVYYDKLIQFKKDDILDASAYIGIRRDDLIDKNELCSKIINHYRKRLELLVDIMNSLERTYTKILSSVKGPICQNVNGYIDDFFTCQKINGIWLNEEQYQKLMSSIRKTDRYPELYKHMKNLDASWKKCMNKLQKAVEIIKKDVDNSMTDDTFNDVVKYVQTAIEKLEKTTDIYYLLVINFK